MGWYGDILENSSAFIVGREVLGVGGEE